MDIRIKRTQKLLEEAMFDLLKEKPVEKITPTELCKKATVNRNTFYSHYASISEFYESIENNLIDTVDTSLEGSKTAVQAITILCTMLKSNPKLSNIIFSKHLSSKIMNRVFVLTNKFNMQKMSSETNNLTDNYKQMLSSYTIMGSAAALECWVKNGMKEAPEEIAEFIYNISKNGSSVVTK
ncbi:MAG: TetR/AcrR family transcriptional regulator [Clostridia bacterium]|nr:TetR/AcrR family transcriptional regulator [Clostridia bacterium]